MPSSPEKSAPGVHPKELWQMEVTHINSFGCFIFVHECADTFEGFSFASP